MPHEFALLPHEFPSSSSRQFTFNSVQIPIQSIQIPRNIRTYSPLTPMNPLRIPTRLVLFCFSRAPDRVASHETSPPIPYNFFGNFNESPQDFLQLQQVALISYKKSGEINEHTFGNLVGALKQRKYFYLIFHSCFIRFGLHFHSIFIPF